MARARGPLAVLVLVALWGCRPEPVAAPKPAPPPDQSSAAPQARGAVQLEEPTIEDVPRLLDDLAPPRQQGVPAADTATPATPATPHETTVGNKPKKTATKRKPKNEPLGAQSPPRSSSVESATTSGSSISPDAIRKVVQGGITEVHRCYERTLLRDPRLSGRVSAAFTIDPTGRVSEVHVEGLQKELESCLEAVIRTWSFPAPRGGGVVRVSYPFVFHAAR